MSLTHNDQIRFSVPRPNIKFNFNTGIVNHIGRVCLVLILSLFSTILSAQTTLPPLAVEADAFTQNGNNNNINFIRLESRAARTRIGYLKFNIPSISGTISKVELKLTIGDDWDNAGGQVSVYHGSSNAWTEGGINGSNAPSTSGQPLAVRPTNAGDRGGDLNIYDLSTADLQIYSGEITFILEHSGSTNDLSYASKEHATAAWHPQLLITYDENSVDTQAPETPSAVIYASNYPDRVILLPGNLVDNVGVTHFDIYLNGIYKETLDRSVVVVNGLFPVEGLLPGTTYSVAMKSVDAAGNKSALSNTSTWTTSGDRDTQAPNVPTGLTVDSFDHESVTVSWNASSDNGGGIVAGYTVYDNGSPFFTTTGTSYTAAVVPNRLYRLSIDAHDNAIPSNISAKSSPTVNFTTPSSNTLEITSFISTLSGTNDVQLDWTVNNDLWADNGQVWYSEGNTFSASNYVGPLQFSRGTISLLVPNLEFGKTYTFALDINTRNLNTGQNLAQDQVTISIPNFTDTEAPESPTLASIDVTDTTVNLTWSEATDNVGVTGYRLSNGSTVLYDGPNTDHLVTGLTSNTEYTFTLSAYDAAGNYSDSSAGLINFTTENSGFGNTPGEEVYTQSNAANPTNESDSTNGWTVLAGNLTITSDDTQSFIGDYSIKIENVSGDWSRAKYSFATEVGKEYRIKIHAKNANLDGSQAGFWQWQGFVQPYGSTDIMDTNWKQYVFNVTADGTVADVVIYPGGPAVPGDVVYIDNISIIEIGTQPPVLLPPTNLTALTPNNNTTTISWTSSTSTAVSGYQLYRNGNLEQTLGDVTSTVVNNLSTTAIEVFVLRAIDGNGNESIDSDTVSVDNTLEEPTPPIAGSYWIRPVNSYDIHYVAGNVGIGTTNIGTWQLAVGGKIRTEEIKVEPDWADYVFQNGYDLPTLQEVEEHIEKKGHLINIPSAAEVEANGIELGEMSKLLLEKIEEITLYVIQHEKRISALETQK